MKKFILLAHFVMILMIIQQPVFSRTAALADDHRENPLYVAPNIYTPQIVVDHMLRLAEVKEGDVVYDLGCGDGRIVITAAREFGARGVGIDIDQEQIKLSRQNAQAAGVRELIEFIQQDLFEADLSQATVITLYLGLKSNKRLRMRLERYLNPGDRVVSHQFDIKGWHPTKRLILRDENRIERTVYLWVIGEHRVPPRSVE